MRQHLYNNDAVIKPVLNYCLLLPARTRQRDGDEKVWKTWEVYFGFVFFGKERISQRCLKKPVCKFEPLNDIMKRNWIFVIEPMLSATFVQVQV